MNATNGDTPAGNSNPNHNPNSQSLSEVMVELFERLSSWELSVVAESGLSLPLMHAVELLGIYGPMKMRDLCARLGVTTGTLTVTVDKLEKAGLVARVANPEDRRSWFIELTEAGKKTQAEHSAYHGRLVAEATSGFSEEELARFADFIRRFVENM